MTTNNETRMKVNVISRKLDVVRDLLDTLEREAIRCNDANIQMSALEELDKLNLEVDVMLREHKINM